MSFNKRFVSKEFLIKNLELGIPLTQIFKADAIIFLDKFSEDVYKLYLAGISEKEIYTKIIKTYENNQTKIW